MSRIEHRRSINRDTKPGSIPVEGVDTLGTGIPPEGQRHEDYFPPTEEKLTPSFYRNRRVQIAGATLALLGTGTVGFLASRGESNNTAADRKPAASASAEPGASETPAEPTTAPAETQSPVVQQTGEITAKDKALVRELDGLSFEEFEKRPTEQRMTYYVVHASWLNETGSLSQYFNQKISNDGTTLAYSNPAYELLTANADPTKIEYQNIYAEQVLDSAKKDMEVDDNGPLDIHKSNRLIAGFSINQKSDLYKGHVVTSNEAVATKINEKSIKNISVSESHDGAPYKDTHGKTFITKVLRIETPNGSSEATYAFVPMSNQLGTDETGKPYGIWSQVAYKNIQ